MPPAYDSDQTQTAFLTDAFLGWHQEQDFGNPWFAHISFLRPHPPFVVPEPYASMVPPERIPDPADDADWQDIAARHPYLDFVFANLPKSSFIPTANGMVRDWSEQDLKVIRAIYYGMIAEVDAQIGRILAALRARGDWEETIVVFTSDHGEMMGDHRLLGKHGFYDQSYHIPLIVRDPVRPEGHGSVVDRFTEAVDVFPTLAGLIGEVPPAHLDGADLAPFLEGVEPEVWRDAAHYEFDFRGIASRTAERHFGLDSRDCNLSVLRDDRFKFVHFAGMQPLLFDLEADPAETRNLADHPDYLRVRIECAERLLAWRARHLDQSLAFTELTASGPVSIAPESGDPSRLQSRSEIVYKPGE